MSLYSSEPKSSLRTELPRNKRFFQIGFVILAVSGLLKAVEVIYFLHRTWFSWSSIIWLRPLSLVRREY